MGKSALVVGRELTKDMEFSGQFLLKKLKAEKLTVDAALWFFYPEISWRYMLVVKELPELGPAYVYKKISDINKNSISKKYKPIPLEAIEAKGDTAYVYKMLKGFARISDGRVRVTNSMVNGLEIVDCLIYELK
ncbi:hypothetical protein RAH17_17090 [Klebsiella pneumoniae]|uniref:Uncharacterized protein n=1 Tax=Klebsiella variicola TaxID=244366 RepID=A0A9P0YBB7_KLEVA|nr:MULTISPECIES: hypothetical protein [Klebsiella]DAZ65585.1 MAG TPA: hypothetical protein [Caudoviricetes sp.]HDU4737612.1 hypothetical protein [Klebsiella pneumoniae subsp. ozaenae]EKW1758173.1 hypothetical protein [Klebsiella pneumoniae]MBX4522147.1 hypothetical protein [Klebsiella pneumoniae]MDG0022188.1 hypothetical protein [Klebsiella pneumoniae]